MGDFAYMKFDELPKDNYEIELRSELTGEGSLPFSLVAFASKQPVMM